VIGRVFALAVLTASLAAGQLQLHWIDAPGSEQPVGEHFDVGVAAAGDILDTRFRIRNIGEASVVLERLRIKGTGFSLQGHPSVPYVVAPGSNVDFRVRFAPTDYGSYSAVLRINDTYVMIFGTSPVSLLLAVEREGVFRRVGSSDTILFGNLEGGSAKRLHFRIENPSPKTLAITGFSISDNAFHLTEDSAIPASLEPGEQAFFFIAFQPPSAGLYRATLSINDRSFLLEGVGSHPPFPVPSMVFSKQAFLSGEQGTLTVELASPSPVSGTGEIRIEFHPSIEGPADDPAIQFLATGSRKIGLHVREGETGVLLGEQPSTVFQTGTTAGTITFTLELGAHVLKTDLPIPPSVVAVESGELSRSTTGLDLCLTGFDNSQSASEISFTFLDKDGRVAGAGPVRASVGDAFRAYFASAQLGGMFSLTARFPVAGDVSLIRAVEVEFTNDAGTSEKRRIQVR